MGVKTPLKHPQEPNVTVNTVTNSIHTDSINNTISPNFKSENTQEGGPLLSILRPVWWKETFKTIKDIERKSQETDKERIW